MLRALILAALICVYCGMPSAVAAQTLSVNKRPPTVVKSSETTSPTNTKVTPSVSTTTSNEVIDSNSIEQERYHPAEHHHPKVVEEFHRQYADGSYEFKYVLSNGVTRYEKSFWKKLDKGKKILARKGFYSHPISKHKFLTVFYTADEHGYNQDTAKFSNEVPKLPKHLNVPQLEFPHETSKPATNWHGQTTTTTRRPITTRKTTTRKPKITTTTRRPVVMPSEFNWIY